MLQARATGALVSRAQQADRKDDPPTIMIGVSRRDLARVARRDTSGSEPGKKLQNFRECTAKKLASKSKVPSWAGFGARPRPLRCKSGQAAPWMIACPQKPGLQCGRWATRAAQAHQHHRASVTSTSSSSKRLATTMSGGYRRLCPSEKTCRIAGGKADTVLVGSSRELYTHVLDAEALHSWLSAIAYGRPTVERDSPVVASRRENVRAGHVPAVRTSAKLRFCPQFIKKHPKLLTAFRAAIRAPGSEWKEDASGTNISSLNDCQAFLQKIRCMPNIAGVHATFLDKPVISSGPLSRYGQPPPHKRRRIGTGPVRGQAWACRVAGSLG